MRYRRINLMISSRLEMACAGVGLVDPGRWRFGGCGLDLPKKSYVLGNRMTFINAVGSEYGHSVTRSPTSPSSVSW
jgi:hypothetical protein